MDNETNLLDKGFVMPIYADWSLLNLCGGKRYYCSNCKGKSKENTKYCPHCGANMRGRKYGK